MPKYRKLYLKTVDSFDVNEMPDDFTRLLWVLLPLGLDAEGRGLDNPSWIKAKVMPLREDVTPEMIDGAVTWFVERGMVIRYEVNGRKYICIPTWHIYQGDTSRETSSDLPAYNSRPTRESVMTKSCSQVDADADADAAQQTNSAPAPSDKYITASDAERIYQDVTGQATFPSSIREHAIETICALAHQHGAETIDYMRPFWDAWVARKRKDGRPYSRASPGWLDWALTGDVPGAPPGNGSIPTEEF